MPLPYNQHHQARGQRYTKGNVSQEVGDQGTHPVVETEVIDEIETQTTAHIVHLYMKDINKHCSHSTH